jgi:superfamily II DNA or RNA helicase
VLAATDRSFLDNRLHVVAAPGSGKTSLGIELFRRLGFPALVLVPTRTIRDQWVSRLIDFAPESDWRAWTSTVIHNPGYLTIATYQALHTVARNGKAEEEGPDEGTTMSPAPTADELNTVAAALAARGVRTLILDEAHHLRREWWKALSSLIALIPDPSVISLTATPPYDVIGKEWRRYEELCGPIDENIGVPELIRIGTLCPHQDYVWAVFPGAQDATTVRRHDAAVATLTRELMADDQWRMAVASHPFVAENTIEPATVLERPELAVALLVFQKTNSRPLPPKLLKLLGTSADEIPALDRRWWSVLIGAYVQDDWPNADKAHRSVVTRRLHAAGLLERGELRVRTSQAVRVALNLSESKVGACADLYRVEKSFRGDSLRQVFLTDFIREDDAQRLGAWGVFHRIVSEASSAEREFMALVTGRVTIVPECVRDAFASIPTVPANGFPGFVQISGGNCVAEVTRLLGMGRLRVLVGTRALLGEGWDAPCVNSLVIASYVGSFMLTNQMRGRAIRSDPEQPGKFSSIWHIVAVDPWCETGRADLEQLERRFDAFVGLAVRGDRIEAGLRRLDLPPLDKEEDLARFNDESQRRLHASKDLAERWKVAVGGDDDRRRVVPAVVANAPAEIRGHVFRNTLRAVVYTASLSGLAVFSNVLFRAWVVTGGSSMSRVVGVAAALAAIMTLPNLYRAIRLARAHAPVDGSVVQIAEVVLDALCEVRAIRTSRAELEVSAPEIEPGVFSIALLGGSYPEAGLIADAVEEVLGPIENPRYLVTRRGRGVVFGGRLDFHTVPTSLGARKETAETFASAWKSHVGPTTLIYTRTEDGRRALLQARARSLATAFVDPPMRRDRWQ